MVLLAIALHYGILSLPTEVSVACLNDGCRNKDYPQTSLRDRGRDRFRFEANEDAFKRQH